MLEKRPYLRTGQLLPRHPQPVQGLSLLPGQESVFMTWDRHEVWFYACPLEGWSDAMDLVPSFFVNLSCCLTTWPDGHNLKGQGCFRAQSDDQISASPYVSKGHPAITKGIQRYLWLVMNITTLCHGTCSFCLMSDIGGLLRLCGLRHCYSMSSTMLWKRGAFLKASGTTRWPHRRVFGGPNADIWASCLTGTPGTEVWHKAARKNNKKSVICEICEVGGWLSHVLAPTCTFSDRRTAKNGFMLKVDVNLGWDSVKNTSKSPKISKAIAKFG